VSYDLIHVCRKRHSVVRKRSWAGIRQEVRRRAREELKAIEKGRYGNEPLLAGTMVDQLVTKERPLPPELEDVDPVSYAWLRVLLKIKREVKVDEVNKALRAMQVTPDELKKLGLIVRGRTGRGRTYEVKQPNERLNALLEKLKSPEIPGGIRSMMREILLSGT